MNSIHFKETLFSVVLGVAWCVPSGFPPRAHARGKRPRNPPTQAMNHVLALPRVSCELRALFLSGDRNRLHES